MNVIIVGGGKVGFYLAKTLIEHDHTPHIIEKDKQTSEEIANSLDVPIICGDGSMADILELAGAKDADAIAAVTGKDEDNLITCQMAKEFFHIKKTISRVSNPKNVKIMKNLGVDIPISSTVNIAKLLERELDAAAIKQLITINHGEASLSEFVVPDNYKLEGISLVELKLPMDSIIVSITRNDKIIIPRGNTQILSGDKIIIMAKDNALHKLCSALKIDMQ